MITADQLASVILEAIDEQRDSLAAISLEKTLFASYVLNDLSVSIRRGLHELGDQ